MKKYFLFFGLLTSISIFAQVNNVNSLSERLNQLEKKIDKFNVYFNFQSSFDAIANDKEILETAFKARQLRLEIKGNITDNLFYRFRHRLNKSNASQSLDNLAKATDMLYVGYKFNDKLTVIGGKQCQAWGGFEFDLNPMNIYEYSDFIEYMDNFMLGVNFIISPNKNQQFQFQITDSRNSRFNDIYGNNTTLESSKSPLTYIVNWNGSFFNNKIQTRWAYGIETQTKNKYSNMLTIGNKLNLKQFQLAIDFMQAKQDIDRLGFASETGQGYLTENNLPFFTNVLYSSYIAKAEFQPNSYLNFFVKGMYETASVEDVSIFNNNFRKSYGYYTGIEYIPFKEQDLKLFLAYIGRKYNSVNSESTYTNRVSLGMMYRIKAF